MARVNPTPPIVAGPAFRIKLFGDLLTQVTVSTFYLVPAVAGNVTPTPTAILASFVAQIEDEWNACLTAVWTGDINTCDRFDDLSIAQIKAPSLLAGSVALGEASPSFVTQKIAKITALGGQRGRGVLRMPGVPESGTAGNQVTGGHFIVLSNLATALLVPVATANPAEGTWQPALLTRTVGLGPLFPATVRGVPITSWSPMLLLGRQISRQQVPRG